MGQDLNLRTDRRITPEIGQGYGNAPIFPIPGITAEKGSHAGDARTGKRPNCCRTGAFNVVRRYGQFTEKHGGCPAVL
jgi:hypothetical protein